MLSKSLNIRPAAFASAIVLLATGGAAAEDWPQFRGPNRDGISPETGLVSPWPESGPRELWRVKLGAGFAGVAAVAGRLYTMDSRGEEELAVCLDAADGREIWRTPVDGLFHEAVGDGPRTTPTVEGERLWAVSSFGQLVALGTAGGERLWSVDLRQRFATPMQVFGFANMPVVVGEHLVIEAGGGDQHSIIAFDKRSGELAWRTSIGSELAYSSPLHLRWRGSEQLLFLDQSNLMSLSPRGEVLWSRAFGDPFLIKVAMPVFVPPDLVVVSASYDLGAMAARLKQASDGTVSAELAWQSRVMRSHFGTPVAVDGLIYGFDNATLKCIDAASGEQLWARRAGFGKGSLIYADGHLIVLSERGKLFLVAASGAGYQQRGAAQILSDRTWPPPALADGRLYVRGTNELVSLDLLGAGRTGGTVAPAAAASPRSPAASELDAATLVARHLEARGGKQALSTIATVRQRGHYLFNGQEYPITIYHKRPNRYRIETRLPTGQLSVEATDGGTGWRENTESWALNITEMLALPLAEIPADAAALIAEDEADFAGPLVDYRSKGHEVELMGASEVAGTPAYHLRVTLASGRVQHFYFRMRDYALLRRTTTQIDPMGFHGAKDRNWYFTEYQRVEGVLFATRWEREDFQLVRTFEIDTIEVGVEIDDSLFAMPRPPAPGSGSAEQ